MPDKRSFFLNLPFQGSSEVLQCPRCQASVAPHPGVCGTCGENVYQCHKCRAINYDEKDPFLCNSCGFSKYAKFDIFLEARSCSAVDPIESEDDRQKVSWMACECVCLCTLLLVLKARHLRVSDSAF